MFAGLPFVEVAVALLPSISTWYVPGKALKSAVTDCYVELLCYVTVMLCYGWSCRPERYELHAATDETPHLVFGLRTFERHDPHISFRENFSDVCLSLVMANFPERSEMRARATEV